MLTGLASSAWPSAIIVAAIVIAATVLSALHDGVPQWFEILAAGGLGHTITASGVTIGKAPPAPPPPTSAPPPPPPPGAQQ